MKTSKYYRRDSVLISSPQEKMNICMKKFYRFYPMLITLMILIITGSAGAYFSGDWKGVYDESSQSGIEVNSHTSYLSDQETIPEGFTKAEWGKIRASIEHDQYRIHKDSRTGAYQAPNHTHDLDATFTREGFDVRPSKEGKVWNWGLRLSRYGYGSDLRSVPETDKIITKDNRIEYHRGDMVEWYINDHRGLEQSFTLNNKPSHPKGVPSSLILEFTLSGTLQPILQGNTCSFLTLPARHVFATLVFMPLIKKRKTLAPALR